MLKIAKEQVIKLKTLQGRLGVDEETYREILAGYGVASCKDLTRDQARDLITGWEKQGKEMNVWQRHKKTFNKYKYDNLGDREGMASPRQLRMLEAMWKEVSFMKSEQARLEAFNEFLSNRFGVDDIKWVEINMVNKIVKVLRVMKAQKAQKEDKCKAQ